MNLCTVLLTAMMLVSPMVEVGNTDVVNVEEPVYTTFTEYMHKGTDEITEIRDCIEYVNYMFMYYYAGSYENIDYLIETYDLAMGATMNGDIAYALEVTNGFIEELIKDDIEFSPYRDLIDIGLLMELEGAVQMMLDDAGIDERLLKGTAVLHILHQE